MQIAKVKASALGGWHDAVTRSGLDPIALTDEVNLDRSVWQDPGSHITLKSFVNLSESVVNTSGLKTLPWLVGERYDLRQLDEVGTAVLSASNLGSSLTRLADHFSLLQDATEMSFQASDDVATISYRILDPDIWPRHYDALFTLGIVAQIVKRAVGTSWDRAELHFEAEARSSRCEFSSALGANCVFGADANEIRMPVSFLNLPMPTVCTNGDLKLLSKKLVQKRRAMPITDRVATIIFREMNDGPLCQERLGAEIGMSSRTMRRKLAAEGISYQDILDDCRMRQAALDFHARPELSISQVALRLGYSEHSTFTRAFTRWSGTAPQQFRRTMAKEAH